MPRTRQPYSPEFWQQILELVRTGRTPNELSWLRKENKRLRQDREILKKAAAWFAQETNSVPPKS